METGWRGDVHHIDLAIPQDLLEALRPTHAELFRRLLNPIRFPVAHRDQFRAGGILQVLAVVPAHTEANHREPDRPLARTHPFSSLIRSSIMIVETRAAPAGSSPLGRQCRFPW